MDELKPCPFCNKPPITTPSGEGGKGLMIECLTEGCVNPHVSYYNHDVARTAWNSRPREDAGVVDDDLRQRCADILTWRKTGSLPFGTALRRFADDRRFDRHETDRLRAAEDATLHEAATALAAALGKSNG